MVIVRMTYVVHGLGQEEEGAYFGHHGKLFRSLLLGTENSEALNMEVKYVLPVVIHIHHQNSLLFASYLETSIVLVN